jgi:phospholipid/cholesterol/gamma-HCH transport system substrate-binding protein
MDLTFSGFPVGRVRHIELGADGNARIVVDVPRRDAHWLRTTSVFTLVRSLVGGASLRAYSGILTDPPLPDGAERPVLIGDASAELPRLVGEARTVLQNLGTHTGPDSALARTLANLEKTSERLNGPRGAMGVLLGSDDDARQIGTALARTNALLARLDGAVASADRRLLGPDGLVANADRQLLGRDGLVVDVRAAVTNLNALLADLRGTLRKVDAVLADAQAVAGNAREATADLGALRGEVDSTVRKVEQLVDELGRRWPFARDTEPVLK